MMLLAPEMGRDAAHRQVQESVERTGSPPGLRDPEDYLGSAESFRLRLLNGKE
jgi:hypothetical protein